ncbi:MAG: hypothetical protein ACREQM_20315 [Candidatus Dormibacteraceae bacterium]
MIVSILVRHLREGMTFTDFEEAWLPEKGFGVMTRVLSLQSLEDPREIVTIGFSDLDVEETQGFLGRVGQQEQVRHDRIEEIIEPARTRTYHALMGDHDLTNLPPIVWSGAGLLEGGRQPE